MHALGLQRDRPQLHHALGRLHLDLARRPAAGQLDQRLVHRAPGLRRRQPGRGPAQVQPDQVGGQTEPVVGGERVRAGIGDHAVGVQPDQAVPGARGGVHVDLLAGERKRSGSDHLGQVGRALQVGELQPARGAHGQQVGVPGDHPEHPALPPDRDGLHPHRHVLTPLRVALADDPALVQRHVQHRPTAARDQVADHVVQVRGGAGVRPHLRQRDVAGAVPGRHPQHQVGEGEVGEQLPLGHQEVDPLHIGAVQGGVVAHQLVQGRHPPTLSGPPGGPRARNFPQLWSRQGNWSSPQWSQHQGERPPRYLP